MKVHKAYEGYEGTVTYCGLSHTVRDLPLRDAETDAQVTCKRCLRMAGDWMFVVP